MLPEIGKYIGFAPAQEGADHPAVYPRYTRQTAESRALEKALDKSLQQVISGMTRSDVLKVVFIGDFFKETISLDSGRLFDRQTSTPG